MGCITKTILENKNIKKALDTQTEFEFVDVIIKGNKDIIAKNKKSSCCILNSNKSTNNSESVKVNVGNK